MKKTIAVALSLVLSTGSVLAQPAPKDESLGTQGGASTRPWAEGVSAENQQQALLKFREANAQLNDGLFAMAVKLYREALGFWDHPAIHYNLALALLNQDQPLEVYDSLQKAIKYGDAPLEKEKYDHAMKYLKLVEQQIATIEVLCNQPGAKVSLDGQELFTVQPGQVGRYEGRVRVGKHTFVAEKAGYETQVQNPFVAPGETFRVDLAMFTDEELTRYKRRIDATWLPWAVLGTGVVAGAVGGLLTLSAQGSFDDYDAAVARCNEDSGGQGCETTPAITDMRDSGESKRSLGYIGYGVAGAALVTGGILLLVNRPRPYRITPEEAKAEAQRNAKGARVSVTPMAGPGMAGAILEGRF